MCRRDSECPSGLLHRARERMSPEADTVGASLELTGVCQSERPQSAVGQCFPSPATVSVAAPHESRRAESSSTIPGDARALGVASRHEYARGAARCRRHPVESARRPFPRQREGTTAAPETDSAEMSDYRQHGARNHDPLGNRNRVRCRLATQTLIKSNVDWPGALAVALSRYHSHRVSRRHSSASTSSSLCPPRFVRYCPLLPRLQDLHLPRSGSRPLPLV
jgi:hypothetical protein